VLCGRTISMGTDLQECLWNEPVERSTRKNRFAGSSCCLSFKPTLHVGFVIQWPVRFIRRGPYWRSGGKPRDMVGLVLVNHGSPSWPRQLELTLAVSNTPELPTLHTPQHPRTGQPVSFLRGVRLGSVQTLIRVVGF
jgi:hypothetical protein